MSGGFKKLGKKLGGWDQFGTDLLTGGISMGVRALTKVPGVRKPAPVVELPDEMETARKARNAAARKRRQGRASTVLSDFGYGGL